MPDTLTDIIADGDQLRMSILVGGNAEAGWFWKLPEPAAFYRWVTTGEPDPPPEPRKVHGPYPSEEALMEHVRTLMQQTGAACLTP